MRRTKEKIALKKAKNKGITVKSVLDYLSNFLPEFKKYEAVRATCYHSKNSNSKSSKKYIQNLSFELDKPKRHLELLPPIQICFKTKKSLGLKKYDIIFDSTNNTEETIIA